MVDTVSSAASSGTQYVQQAAQKTADTVAPVAQDISSNDNAAAVSQLGTDLNKAGVDNSCNDNTVGSKLCNGVLGGASGANSVATDGLNAYTHGDYGPEADKAGQTVSDSVIKSAGYEIDAAGKANGDPQHQRLRGAERDFRTVRLRWRRECGQW